MRQVGVSDAKTTLSELIAGGVAVAITKRGKPVAVLTPIRENPQDVIARIRAMRAGAPALSMQTIEGATRSGRR